MHRRDSDQHGINGIVAAVRGGHYRGDVLNKTCRTHLSTGWSDVKVNTRSATKSCCMGGLIICPGLPGGAVWGSKLNGTNLNEMKEIQLTQGMTATIDDEMFDRVNMFKWCVLRKKYKGNTGYYATTKIRGGGKKVTILMHQLIIGIEIPKNHQIDHKDGNGLNNTLTNLRICTNSQNQMNKVPQIYKTSKYKGVLYSKQMRKYQSYIRVNGKAIHLGFFDDEICAAIAYNEMAQKHFGEFAKLNVCN